MSGVWQWYDPRQMLDADVEDAEERLVDMVARSPMALQMALQLERWFGLQWQRATNDRHHYQAEGIHRVNLRLRELLQQAHPDKK